ncbi:XRE family transcriptional regulator [Intestinimonas massiliensis (ex Afouda et al. 2020)]|uniref:XRE family transcriptional regulator n=1 Tax=Intestinimonas massiliensis (ex Afouda et al. 2020) TaxID=1673721 RepID=UPI001F5FA260|nr:XRE family transcriptional regulator [Intestinimonas massiliensis (ex Afouda et al. 2020)]
MEQEYMLRLYDMDLLAFSLAEQGIEGLKAQIHSIREDDRALFPLDLELTDDGLVKWLQRRVIPKNRAYVAEILKTFSLSINDTRGIIDVCKGLSLNDSYWVVPQGFTGTFAQYNLYENRFSEILSLVAYTGIGQSDAAFTTSPELTTNGMLPKAWRFIEGEGIYLYKGGTFGAANTGNEPYSEFYASQVAQAMGLDAVAYELENWKGILASRCKLFTDIDTAYIPIGHIVREGGLKACMEYYRQLGPEAYEQIKSMLVLDTVIYNEDRHFGNFGVLRDNHTGKVTSAAPVFDNGMSLFNFAMPEDFKDLDSYARTRGTPYGISFETVCREVMGPVQMGQLRKLIGFTFQRHPRLNLPDDRLLAIERHLQKRVRQLLDLNSRPSGEHEG